MEAYHRDKGEEAKYKIRIRSDVPKQLNGTDCGVFLCQYAERLGREKPWNFSQQDIADIRVKMAWEILNGELREDISIKHDQRQKTSGKSKLYCQEESRATKKTSQKMKVKKESSGSQQEGSEAVKKAGINWPKSNSPEWKKLDTDLSSILSSDAS